MYLNSTITISLYLLVSILCIIDPHERSHIIYKFKGENSWYHWVSTHFLSIDINISNS